jgi:uncharacterized protein YoxC
MTAEENRQMLVAAISNGHRLEMEVNRLQAENARLREHNNMLAMEIQAYVEHIDELLEAVRAAGITATQQFVRQALGRLGQVPDEAVVKRAAEKIDKAFKPRRPRRSSRSTRGPSSSP